jgi:hypothetical protein
VAGKIALLHPADNGNVLNNFPYSVGMQLDGATVSAIASAGAVGILVAPPSDGITYVSYNPADVPAIPTALLSYQDAARLAGLPTAGRSGVTVTSAWPSSYTYALTFTRPGQGGARGRAGQLGRVSAGHRPHRHSHRCLPAAHMPARRRRRLQAER